MRTTPTATGMTVEELAGFELAGLQLQMSPEDVIEALETEGWVTPVLSRMATDMGSTAVGLRCAGGCERIGQEQSRGYLFERENLEADVQPETLLPLFYVDEEGQQRLYYVKYTRPFPTEIFPANLLEQMKGRFGEPAKEESWESYAKLTYRAYPPVPAGYEVRRAAGETSLAPSQRTRIQCASEQRQNFPEAETPLCQQVLAEAAMPQHLYSAFDSSQNRRGTEVATVTIKTSELLVELNASQFAAAVRSRAQELEVAAELAELRERAEAATSVDIDF